MENPYLLPGYIRHLRESQKHVENIERLLFGDWQKNTVHTNKDFQGLIEEILKELNEGLRPVDGNVYFIQILKPISQVNENAKDYFAENYENVHFRKVNDTWQLQSKIEYV